ncbi:MAG TPA: ThiF family adenylyltransferase [Thermomicrobiales bacterium]|nr:ThiF family adenylyltransferase [Thermomicrobiales bacterium]
MNQSTSVIAPSPASQLNSARTADRYVRQERFFPIGREGQRRLATTHVVQVGCGALGSASAELLTRAGIGRLTLIDRDYVELHNLQRQSLFSEEDVAEHVPKAAAAARRLEAINGEVEIRPEITDLHAGNAERLLADADIILDGTDNFETRYLINDVAVKFGIPWVYGGVIASGGSTMTIRPEETPCLRCVFPDPPEPGSVPTCDTAGVIGPAVQIVAAIQAAEAMKLAVGDLAATNQALLSFDVWPLDAQRVPLPPRDPECPTCGQRQFSFLESVRPSQTTQLCGHDAVQVLVSPAPALNLEALADRLRPLGKVLVNRFLLRFDDPVTGRQLTVFPDGRAIVQGTTDATEARSLYAKYIGA